MTYLAVKWLHVLSSTLLFGTGLCSAYYMVRASLTRDARTTATVIHHVVLADWMFTATEVVIQPATGLYMVHLAGLPLQSRWIVWSIALYLSAGACWLPVVWMQLRMRDLARRASARNEPLPDAYWRYYRAWMALGIPAFLVLVVVFWLMVAKPV